MLKTCETLKPNMNPNCAQLYSTVLNCEQHPEPGFVNPIYFEQPVEKIELEDQSSEIERLNEIIKNLKKEFRVYRC